MSCSRAGLSRNGKVIKTSSSRILKYNWRKKNTSGKGTIWRDQRGGFNEREQLKELHQPFPNKHTLPAEKKVAVLDETKEVGKWMNDREDILMPKKNLLNRNNKSWIRKTTTTSSSNNNRHAPTMSTTTHASADAVPSLRPLRTLNNIYSAPHVIQLHPNNSPKLSGKETDTQIFKLYRISSLLFYSIRCFSVSKSKCLAVASFIDCSVLRGFENGSPSY